MSNKKAVISLSGGLDSTMLLMKLLADGYEVRAYSFNYGQKHDIELKKVKKNIKFLQSKGLSVTHQELNVQDCFSDSASSLHKSGGNIPKGEYDDGNMKSTVVENRNIIFSAIIYGKALSWSKKTDSDVVITLGIHKGDHSLYPDTTTESFEAAKHTFEISNWSSERVNYIAPFVNKEKGELLAEGWNSMTILGFTRGEKNKVLRNTHSCYDPNEKGESCGQCGTCKERLEAFERCGIKDPIKYA